PGRSPRADLDPADRQLGRRLAARPGLRDPRTVGVQPAGHRDRTLPALQLVAYRGNLGPLVIFGFLAAYRGIKKFFGVTAVVILASGLAAWLTEPANSVGAGASGLVFGYFGYIMVRGLFDRHLIDILVGAVMALCFAYQFTVL